MTEPTDITTTTPTFTPELEQQGKHMRLSLHSGQASAAMSAMHLVIAGHEMNAASKTLGERRGGGKGREARATFADWLATYAVKPDGKPYSETWARQLMKCADAHKLGLADQGDAETLALLAVAPSQMDAPQMAALLDATKEFAGDAGINSLMAELNIKHTRKTGTGTGTSTPREETCPAGFTVEMWDAYKQLEDGSPAKQAAESVRSLLPSLLPLSSTDADIASPHVAHLPPLFADALYSLLTGAAKRLAPMVKKLKPPKKKKAKKTPAKKAGPKI